MPQQSTVSVFAASGAVVTIKRKDGDDKLQNTAYPAKQADMFMFELEFDQQPAACGEIVVQAFTPADMSLNGEETFQRTLGHNWKANDGDEFCVLAGRANSYSEADMAKMGEFRFTKYMDTTPSIVLPQIEHEVLFRVSYGDIASGHLQYHAMSDVFNLQLEQELPDGNPSGPEMNA